MDGEDDPYASILEICKPSRSLINNIPFVPPPETLSGRLYGPIPADSLRYYLCPTPPPEAHNNNEDITPCVESFQDLPQSFAENSEKSPENYLFSTPPAEAHNNINNNEVITPCVVSFQDSPPWLVENSAESLGNYLFSTPPDAHNNINTNEDITPCVESFQDSPLSFEGCPLLIFDNQEIPTDVDNGVDDEEEEIHGGRMEAEGPDLWLSWLKSMAMTMRKTSNDVVYFWTKFRVSVSRGPQTRSTSEKKRNLDSSSKLKEKVLGSVSGKPPSKELKRSENILLLESSKSNARSEFVDAYEVVRPGCLLSKSKSKGKNIAAESPLKKHKHSENTLGLESSKSKCSSELVETDCVNVIVLSEEEEESCGALVLGVDTVKEGVPSKESGGSKADGSHTNAAGSSLGTKNTEDLEKSRRVGSGVCTNRSSTGQRERASLSRGAATTVNSGCGVCQYVF